jgi:hypothetical protein
MLRVRDSGSFGATKSFLKRASTGDAFKQLDGLARAGVSALSSATPKDSGETAASWSYTIMRNTKTTKIVWTNSHKNAGVNVAVILQYGHGTGTGGYVAGIDYINPAVRPIFDQIANQVWSIVKQS